MKGKAHAIGGMIAAGTTIYLAYHYNYTASLSNIDIIVGSFLGSLLPDIDHKKSMLGSIIYLPVKHRTLTHSIVFMVLVSAFVMHYNLNLGVGVFVGILSHLILDMMGKRSAGICLFYPFKKRFAFFRFL